MSLEAILTVITVVLAVIALTPEERGQDLRIRLGGSAAAVVILTTALMLYWALLEPLHALPGIRRLPRVLPWPSGWGPASGSLAVFLAAAGYCLWTYAQKVPVTRLPRLASALSDALARRRFGECAHLLEAHLGTIRDGLEGNYWQRRLRKRLFPTYAELHLKALTKSGQPNTRALKGPTKSDSSLLSIFSAPTPREPPAVFRPLIARTERPADAAHHLVRSVGLSPPLVRHIAASNPYLGLALSLLPSTWLAREFSEVLAQTLVSDPESVLYRELRRAENLDFNNVPVVDPVEQPFLAILCDEVESGSDPRLLYTFLEAGIHPVRDHSNQDLRRELSGPIGDYYERTRWFSPPFSTIYLLEITAPRNAVAAGAQSINLYVLRTLTNALLHQLSPSEEVDATREWPTPTHYLLYACVSVLVDVVGIWQHRLSDLPAAKLTEDDDGLPRVLPAHAIDVLSSVMKALLQSAKLSGRFKGYLLEVWWRAYWAKYQGPWAHSETVLARLVKGGRYGGGDVPHRTGIAEALEYVDIVHQVSEGGNRIRAAFGLPAR